MSHCIAHLELIQSYTPLILQQKCLRRLLKHQAASLVERRDLSLTLMKENRKREGKARRSGGGEGQKEGTGGEEAGGG